MSLWERTSLGIQGPMFTQLLLIFILIEEAIRRQTSSSLEEEAYVDADIEDRDRHIRVMLLEKFKWCYPPKKHILGLFELPVSDSSRVLVRRSVTASAGVIWYQSQQALLAMYPENSSGGEEKNLVEKLGRATAYRSSIQAESLQTNDGEDILDNQLSSFGNDVFEGPPHQSSTPPSIKFNFEEFEDPLLKSSSLPLYNESVYDVYDDYISVGVLDLDQPIYDDEESKLDASLEPQVTLHHLDIPQVLQDEYGGWLSPKIIDDFKELADVCFKEFGDRDSYWTTMNEPNINSFASLEYGLFPSRRCSHPYGTNCTGGHSTVEPYITVHNYIMAHSAVAELYRKKYPD
ncbi:hypothetical protein M5K25_002360 [Dendrobium thyrsiflorum]|uniref:Uncharacterized protein n=1 Tax=Dendrobium thyrsiflorum TaxID=117978 RepID=A0ABD0VSE8_DENTH